MTGEWLTSFRALAQKSNFSIPRVDGAKIANIARLSSVNDIAPTSGSENSIFGTIGTQDQKNHFSEAVSGAVDESANAEAAATDWRALYEIRAAVRGECLAWAELQNRWHMANGDRVSPDLCAGCRKPIGNAPTLHLIDGCRVHFADNGCLIQHGEHWRMAATRALLALGLRPPTNDNVDGQQK
jgi:hypothetical protein